MRLKSRPRREIDFPFPGRGNRRRKAGLPLLKLASRASEHDESNVLFQNADLSVGLQNRASRAPTAELSEFGS